MPVVGGMSSFLEARSHSNSGVELLFLFGALKSSSHLNHGAVNCYQLLLDIFLTPDVRVIRGSKLRSDGSKIWHRMASLSSGVEYLQNFRPNVPRVDAWNVFSSRSCGPS